MGANERTDDHFDDEDSFDQPCPRLHRHTKIQYYWQDIDAINDAPNDDAADNENEEEEKETECVPRRTLNFDVTTTTFDRYTNTVIQSKSFGHAIRVNDLFCDDEDEDIETANVRSNQRGGDVARSSCGASSQGMFVPRLLLQFGAGVQSLKSPRVMRIFKETVSDTGRHLVRNHGLTALVMSFAGIAAVTAASSGLDDIL